MLVPDRGCRIIIASDGLWDVISLQKAVVTSRRFGASAAAAELMVMVNRERRVIDDTSIIIVDVLPPDAKSFPASLAAPSLASPGRGKKPGSGGGGGGLFGCFQSDVIEPDSRHATGPGRLQLYADVDCLQVLVLHVYCTCTALVRLSRVF